jgi:cellulose synthase/poly-beta-1,6-N-acetylglucosamine synthase-like glycosyltransferase
MTDFPIIITLDADTLFRKNTIKNLVRKFVDKRVSAVAGNTKVGNRVNLLTSWQALEYITSQNLDRRAFEVMNCITVVPGSVGAWRRDAVAEAGGFSDDTLAEDADLTFSIIRNKHLVAFDDEAIGLTEAPDNSKDFITQRFRWMYGTFQTVWKHRSVLVRRRPGALGLFAVPNVFIFQIFFPLISPLMDLMMVFSIGWIIWQKYNHQIDFSPSQNFHQVLTYYFLFLAIDFITAAIPFFLEKNEQWSLLIWLPLQRFYYRQLMYYVAIKSIFTAIKGKIVGWGKLARKATVRTAN